MVSKVAVNVGADQRDPSHDIALVGKDRTVGFMLDDGITSFLEGAASDSTILTPGGNSKLSFFDPHYASIEQTSWQDGAGFEVFSSLETGFADSMNAFTMKDGVLFPAPQWKYATGGILSVASDMPGDVQWYPLHTSNKRYVSQIFTPSANITSRLAWIWVRRVGKPGTLTCELCANSAGSPSTILQTATLAAGSTIDPASFLNRFAWSANETLTGSTSYHLKLYGASTDSADNHWEIGMNDNATTNGKSSADNSAWSALSLGLYYRVTDLPKNVRYAEFRLLGAKYVLLDYIDTATASRVFIQGDRGKATSTAAVDTTSLVDTARSWTTDEWVGSVVYIVQGAGVGQYRTITANTSTTLTVDEGWDIALTTASVFVILGSKKWTEVSTTGLGNATDVAVQNDVAYFAQGTATNIRKMEYNTTTKTHDFGDDGTNKANHLESMQHPVDGPQMWRSLNAAATTYNAVSRAPAVASGSNHVFAADIKIGGTDSLIRDLAVYDNELWIFTDKGPFAVRKDRAETLFPQMDMFTSTTNGAGSVQHDESLFIPVGGFAIQQAYGGSLIDASRKRMPPGRSGHYGQLLSHPAGLFAGIDAGRLGTSSVNFRDDARYGWHEVFRAPRVGERVRNVWWDSVPGIKPKLWMSVGADLIYQEWPEGTLDPLQDSTMNYQHEFTVETATHDFGTPSLPKYIKDVKLISKNLNSQTKRKAVYLDYQVDLIQGIASDVELHGVDSGSWNTAGAFTSSPEDIISFEIGNVRRIKFRLRGLTDEADTPPIVYGLVIRGNARTITKRTWTARLTIANDQVTYTGGEDFTPQDVIPWLRDKTDNAESLMLRTAVPDMDRLHVFVEPISRRIGWGLNEDGTYGATVYALFKEA